MHVANLYLTAPKVEPLLLVEEISHRVINEYAQVIAGIRLAARESGSDKARAALAAAASRLLNFAEAHRALQAPIQSGDVDLTAALNRLCVTISIARMHERGIKLTLSGVPVSLAAERCWRVMLIVSELITNSMRHGLRDGPGNIRVEVELSDQTAICRVVDDGCGKGMIKPGRGFDVVNGLASEISGGVGWCFAPGCTIVKLVFPLVVPEPVK